MFLLAAASVPIVWPFVVLALCVASIVAMISWLRVHAFVALIFAAFLAGFLADSFSPSLLGKLSNAVQGDAKASKFVAAVELTSMEFGTAAASFAISVGLASILGLCLMESGAADKVVRRFLAVFGEKRAALALLASTYLLSIPMFFNTVFMLMVPLARTLRLRTGKDYLLYLMAICCAGVITHSLTVPHPGPLFMVSNLGLDAGASLGWGIVMGLVPCFLGYLVARRINARLEVPLRDVPGASLDDLRGISARPESELPGFIPSVAPILIPVLLITAASVSKMIVPDGNAPWAHVALFLGQKDVALFLGLILAAIVLIRSRKLSFRQMEKLFRPPVEAAGMIILISSAGGAFGAMLRHAGVGEAIKALAEGYKVNLIVLGWVVAAVLRIAQGSATVAMLTTSAIIAPMVTPALPYNAMYVFLSVGFGAFCCSWMNDSGFWVVSRLGGLTEGETLRSWTVLLTVTAIIGLIFTFLMATVLPLKG